MMMIVTSDMSDVTSCDCCLCLPLCSVPELLSWPLEAGLHSSTLGQPDTTITSQLGYPKRWSARIDTEVAGGENCATASLC